MQQRRVAEKEQRAREARERKSERLARNMQIHPPRELSTRRQREDDTMRVGVKARRRVRDEKEREVEKQAGGSRDSRERRARLRPPRHRHTPSRRVSRWFTPSDSTSASSVVVSRQLADYRRARVVIVGAGPAGLAAACQLADEGYYDVVILEARDRIGGRVHTIDLQQLVEQRMRAAQHAADMEDEARLRRLSGCSQLGVVDEGAAFVHGYTSRNRVSQYIPTQHTHPKSEHREQWRDERGQPVDIETVNEARRIYSYIDHTVLQTLRERAAHIRSSNKDEKEEKEAARGEERDSPQQAEEGTTDSSFGQCFDEALMGLWARKRSKWQTDIDGEEEDERWIREQEVQTAGRPVARGGRSRGKRRRDEQSQLLSLQNEREEDACDSLDVRSARRSSVARRTVVSSRLPISAPVSSFSARFYFPFLTSAAFPLDTR